MLPKAHRLTKKKDFMKLAVQGRSIFGSYATLRFKKSSEPETKIAFIISTKVFKKAVDRNRARRRMRAVMRSLLPELPERMHLLFVLKPECRTAKFELLMQEAKRMILKIPEALSKPPKPSARGMKWMKKGARTSAS